MANGSPKSEKRKVSHEMGLFVGNIFSPVEVAGTDGTLYQKGVEITATAAELNLIDGSTAGTNVASKALVPDANKGVDLLRITTATLAAAGANQTNAAQVVAYRTFVTASDGAKGVKLPTAVSGDEVTIINTVTSKGLIVYPATGASINALTANSAIVIPAGGVAVFKATSATQWYTNRPIMGSLYGSWAVADITTSGATVNISGVAGFRFVPVMAYVKSVGAAVTTATLIRIKEETGGTVLFSWPIAALGADGAVAGIGASSAVFTGLGVPQPTAGKGFVMDATGANAGGTTTIEAYLYGYYI